MASLFKSTETNDNSEVIKNSDKDNEFKTNDLDEDQREVTDNKSQMNT